MDFVLKEPERFTNIVFNGVKKRLFDTKIDRDELLCKAKAKFPELKLLDE